MYKSKLIYIVFALLVLAGIEIRQTVKEQTRRFIPPAERPLSP
ncbi:hypothetical protein [Paenibacillus beijingensis]|nr:hypothetical protein [Paenibacillus beijingensis]